MYAIDMSPLPQAIGYGTYNKTRFIGRRCSPGKKKTIEQAAFLYFAACFAVS